MTFVNLVSNGVVWERINCRTIVSAEEEYKRLLQEAVNVSEDLGKGTKVFVNMYDKYNNFKAAMIIDGVIKELTQDDEDK